MKMCSHTSPDASDNSWAIAQRSFAVLFCMHCFRKLALLFCSVMHAFSPQVLLRTHHLGCIHKLVANTVCGHTVFII